MLARARSSAERSLQLRYHKGKADRAHLGMVCSVTMSSASRETADATS